MLDNQYDIGDIVYLVTDEHQLARVVTAICIRGNLITYELSCGSWTPTWHLELELSPSKDILKSLNY